MNEPLISVYCAVHGCLKSPGKTELCSKHERNKKIASVLIAFGVALGVALLFAILMSASGCAAKGPSKDRLRELLSQCRDANRQRVRIIKEYEASNCRTNPSQEFGTINFSEAGN